MSSESVMQKLLKQPSPRDIRAFELINRHRTHAVLDWVLPRITHVGLGGVQLSLIGLLWWFQREADPRLASLPWNSIAAFLLATGLVHLVKRRVKRLRPVMHTEVRFLAPVTRCGSFPSGHTATSFALACVVAAYYPAWTPALLLLAGVIGYSRVYVGLHFVSDVLAGAAIGLLAAIPPILGIR